MPLEFAKMHGLGNDFMVLDLVTQTAAIDDQQIRAWADRRTGVGFDQLLLIETPTDPDADKRKKRKGKPEDAEAEKKFIQKKFSFSKKAVVEADELYDDQRLRKPRKGAKGKREAGQKAPAPVAKAIKRRIKVDDNIVVSELAKRLGVKAGAVIKVLMGMGTMAGVTQSVDYDTVGCHAVTSA